LVCKVGWDVVSCLWFIKRFEDTLPVIAKKYLNKAAAVAEPPKRLNVKEIKRAVAKPKPRQESVDAVNSQVALEQAISEGTVFYL
jgi:hypothetical protein